jgi:hypothetical protein
MSSKQVGIGLALLLLAGAAVGVSAVHSDPPVLPKPVKGGKQPLRKGAVPAEGGTRKAPSRAARPREIISALRAEVDLSKAEAGKVKLQDIIEWLSGQLTENAGKGVRIWIDVSAFKAENPEVNTEQLLGEEIEFPVFRRMAIGTVLRIALSRIPTNNATYLVRPGGLEITTLKAASPESRLREPVAASFDQRPLDEALAELSDLSGASIVLDARAAEKGKTPVTATFLHDTSLAGVLRLLADMADLRVVMLEGTVYVTTPENAERLQKEKAPLLAPPPPAPEAAASQTVQVPDRPDQEPGDADLRHTVSLLEQVSDWGKVSEKALTLRKLLVLISDKLTKANGGKEVIVMIDFRHFKAQDDKLTLEDILKKEVEFPAFPKKMTLRTALRIAVGSIPTNTATYRIRRDFIDITTQEAAFQSGTVSLGFNKVPLRDALDEVWLVSGARIDLDPDVCAEKLATPVTVTFRKGTPVATAVHVLGKLTGVAAVIQEDHILVTTTANAARLEKEKKARPLKTPNP